MSTPNLQIENGGFVDFEGNPLALGYLLLQLSHDENYSIGPNQVVAGLKLQVNLNASGNIPVSPAVLIYSNDVLTPSGSYYIVRAFKADGTEAWASPQIWNLASSPNPLDVGTIVPASPPGAGLGGGGTTLLLETNGTVNSNQALLNLVNGANVTITNSSGNTTIAAAGGFNQGTSLWVPGSATTNDFINIGDFMTGTDGGATISFPAPTSTSNYSSDLAGNRFHIGQSMFYAGRNFTFKTTTTLNTVDSHTEAAVGLFSSTSWISLGSGSASTPTGSFVAFSMPNNNSGTWHAIVSGGGSTTDVDTLVASNVRNAMEIDYTPTSVVFKINASTVATITTNIPTTAAMGVLWYSNHLTGSAPQTLITEYISCTSTPV